MSLVLEGFTHLIPFAAGHEIIRQQRRALTLIRMTPDLIYDQNDVVAMHVLTLRSGLLHAIAYRVRLEAGSSFSTQP